MDPLALQRNVKNNASEIQNAIADLTSWEDGIKTRDKKLLKVRAAPCAPLRKALAVPARTRREKARQFARAPPSWREDLPADGSLPNV
jgi:hypothetical protein